jgi:hypothetical protein
MQICLLYCHPEHRSNRIEHNTTSGKYHRQRGSGSYYYAHQQEGDQWDKGSDMAWYGLSNVHKTTAVSAAPLSAIDAPSCEPPTEKK